MDFALWSVIVGLLLIFMALSGSVLARLPLSTAMLYLMVGIAISPVGAGLLWLAPRTQTHLLERLAEVVVLISLFGAGLKLSPGLTDRRWLLPLRLAIVSMLITVGMIAAVGVWLLDLPLGAAVLLGAILAPTDPVLASDVQVQAPGDRDSLRFALTGEGGLNDGTAFPFVLLGLGLLGLHDIGSYGWRWALVDGVWATASGLAIGTLLGGAVGKLVLYLRRTYKEAVGLDDFIAMGLIALSYGVALLAHGYGFLAVFAAGVALRHLERRETAAAQPVHPATSTAMKVPDPGDMTNAARTIAVHPQHAPAYMAHAVLGFNEKIERIAEVVAVVVTGALLWAVTWRHVVWWFVPLLLLVIRPLSVALGLAGSRSTPQQRGLIAWFGIRGIGSIYYLAYAINHGLAPTQADVLTALTLSVVVTSIVVHGISVTPLMALYERSRGGPRPEN
jgi:sodium/hydrogen antiporter